MNNRPIKLRFWDKEYSHWRELPDLYGDYQASAFRTYGEGFDIKHFLSGEAQEKIRDGILIIQQFTGLTDSTGKEIYEGDICLYRKQYREVRIGEFWDGVDDRVGVFLQDPKVIHRNFGTNKLDSISSCEVFGNIFETPELLV